MGSMQWSFEKEEARDISQFPCLEVLRCVNSGRFIVCNIRSDNDGNHDHHHHVILVIVTTTCITISNSIIIAKESETIDVSSSGPVSSQNAPLAMKSIVFLVPACWILSLDKARATSPLREIAFTSRIESGTSSPQSRKYYAQPVADHCFRVFVY